MRILLDSRDLIELTEHSNPVTADHLNAYLRAGQHQTILTFTNVRELASPLARSADFMRIRGLLQALENLPHTYLREVTVVAFEIQAAIDAFNNGLEYRSPSMYVRRWDHTLAMLPGQQRSATDNWINLRLDEIIYYIFRISPHVFAPPEHHLAALQRLLQQDRDLLRAGQVPARKHFITSVKRHSERWGLRLPFGREDEFAQWIHANPNRCPGFRLNHETYRALMANYTDVPETADFSDLAQISAIPYVEAATLDNRMRHYVSSASRKLVKLGATQNYANRIYENLAMIMQRHPN